MQCSRCGSTHIRKNGVNQGKQNHICVNCRRQFIDAYDESQTYSDETKQRCLTLYVNGLGFRVIERATEVHHATCYLLG
jgi:transposase-like protein